jgi:hypothetical protein
MFVCHSVVSLQATARIAPEWVRQLVIPSSNIAIVDHTTRKITNGSTHDSTDPGESHKRAKCTADRSAKDTKPICCSRTRWIVGRRYVVGN